MRLSTVINIIGLVVILVAVINLIAFREVWVLVVAMAVLAALAIYSVKEKQKLRQGSSQKSCSGLRQFSEYLLAVQIFQNRSSMIYEVISARNKIGL